MKAALTARRDRQVSPVLTSPNGFPTAKKGNSMKPPRFQYCAPRRLEEALRSYERALASRDQPAFVPTDRTDAGWRALLAMAEIEVALGRVAMARDHLENAHALAPDSVEVREALARIAAVSESSAR